MVTMTGYQARLVQSLNAAYAAPAATTSGSAILAAGGGTTGVASGASLVPWLLRGARLLVVGGFGVVAVADSGGIDGGAPATEDLPDLEVHDRDSNNPALQPQTDGAGVRDGLPPGCPSGPNWVYRALRPDETPEDGLVARSPGATSVDPISHVAGKIASPWISTTKSCPTALNKFGAQGVTVVAVDVSQVVTEVRRLERGIDEGGRFSSYAKSDQEVLIRDFVPAAAIVVCVP